MKRDCWQWALAAALFLSLSGWSTADAPPKKWAMPEPSRSVIVEKTIIVPAGQSVDFNYTRFIPSRKLGDGSQREAQRPVIALMKGASIRRVIIGSPGADGIHCRGDNVLRDVWFEDVGEDAVTVEGPNVQWLGGGARNAEDKIVQMNHKGPFIGKNLYFENFVTGVRGNGTRKFKEIPFRAHLDNIGARKGECLLRFTNKPALGEIGHLYLEAVDHVGRADNGAKIIWREQPKDD